MTHLDTLVQATIAGDTFAWQSLQTELCAAVEEMARCHESLRSRQMQGSGDEVSEIRLATFERLARDDFRNLRRYQEQRDSRGEHAQSLDSWLYGAVDYTIREHLRRRYGRAPNTDALSEGMSLPSPSKRAVNTLADRFDVGVHDHALAHTLGITAKLTAEAILGYVAETFAPDEARALRMYYLEEQSFEDIATALNLKNAQAADKLIRKLNARLRYKFNDEDGSK